MPFNTPGEDPAGHARGKFQDFLTITPKLTSL
jgi:hypothetical protein